MDNFTRDEVQDLKKRAEFAAQGGGAQSTMAWKIAYLELSAAADRIDAMLARDELANQERPRIA